MVDPFGLGVLPLHGLASLFWLCQEDGWKMQMRFERQSAPKRRFRVPLLPKGRLPGAQLAAGLTGFLAVGILACSTVAGAADFIGSESCRSCHQQAYEQWSKSAHAKSRLSASDRQNPYCLSCHARDADSGGEFGVSCETCHGAGEHYWPSYVMRDSELSRAVGLVIPDAASCETCHGAGDPSLLPFDSQEAMKAIDHWSHSRAQGKSPTQGAKPGKKAQNSEKGGDSRTQPHLVAKAASKIGGSELSSPAKSEGTGASASSSNATSEPLSLLADALQGDDSTGCAPAREYREFRPGSSASAAHAPHSKGVWQRDELLWQLMRLGRSPDFQMQASL